MSANVRKCIEKDKICIFDTDSMFRRGAWGGRAARRGAWAGPPAPPWATVAAAVGPGGEGRWGRGGSGGGGEGGVPHPPKMLSAINIKSK